MEKIRQFFKFGERKTNFKVETIAGITTFMTMAYILVVQPTLIVGSDVSSITDINGVVITKEAILVTCALVSAIITLLMAFYANLPFALGNRNGKQCIIWWYADCRTTFVRWYYVYDINFRFDFFGFNHLWYP